MSVLQGKKLFIEQCFSKKIFSCFYLLGCYCCHFIQTEIVKTNGYRLTLLSPLSDLASYGPWCFLLTLISPMLIRILSIKYNHLNGYFYHQFTLGLNSVWLRKLSHRWQHSSLQRRHRHNLHFYDWHILGGQVHDRLSLHEFDSEKADLVSWLQHLFQERYRKQHCD